MSLRSSAGVALTAEHITLANMNPDHLLLAGAETNDMPQIHAVRVCAHV